MVVNDSTKNMPAEALRELEAGNKIGAIKVVRLEHNLDLKDSKEFVDAYIKHNPGLEQRLSAMQAGIKRKFMMWMLGIGFALLLYLYLSNTQ